MRRAAVLLALALSACAQPRTAAVFECAGLGDVIVRHGNDDALVTIAGRDMALPRAPAASGVRYQQGGTQVWEHQGELMVDFDGRHVMGCKRR